MVRPWYPPEGAWERDAPVREPTVWSCEQERRLKDTKRVKYLEDGRTIYEHICDIHNIHQAIRNAARDHAHEPQVIAMREDPWRYAGEIYTILKNGEFHYAKFRQKDIVERGKKRHLLFTITYPDRVIQHCLFQVVGPILLGTCTADTYAAQEGRGTHLMSDRIMEAVQNDPENTRYYLQFDIRKYFDSIDRNVLWGLIKRKIKDADTLELLHRIIFEVPGERGLPIGLYSSQILSTFFLSYFGHWLKETLHVPHCFIYMDDGIIFASSKVYLHRVRKAVEQELKRYHLKLKGNWRIRPIATGADIVGYVHYPTHKVLRKRTKISYKRTCNAILRFFADGRPISASKLGAMRSYNGQAIHCSSKHLRSLCMGHVLDVLGPVPKESARDRRHDKDCLLAYDTLMPVVA